jgi:hypothetical protein
MGLVNALNNNKGQPGHRDALLGELRRLARAYPDDDTPHENFTVGLYDALIDAKDEQQLERRDALIEELHELARAYPDDSVIREMFTQD